MQHLFKMTNIFFFLSLLSICCITSISPISTQCLHDQKSLLLGLKKSLIFTPAASLKLVRWNRSTDCCSWDGVECDVAGHVVSLQLDNETISGGIKHSKNLFSLTHLQKLNLAYNNFTNILIPKGLHNLTNLTHLNLSNAGFSGQVPAEISRMTRLISLDLSSSTDIDIAVPLQLENPNFKLLVQNLTRLEELYLDYVNVSAQGSEWCQVLSSSLPDLRILSLRKCHISGPICPSLATLQSLSVLDLVGNELASSVPNSFASFSKLATLSLAGCSLLGSFPKEIFQIPTLQDIDISSNELLSGNLPRFPSNGSLRSIVVSWTNFSGSLPDSISNLRMLSTLDLFGCRFDGPLPLFHLCKKLTYVDAAYNNLNGSLSSMHFGGLPNLAYIRLAKNLLTGNIPSSLFALPSLQTLHLSNNKFHGPVQEVSNPSSSLAVIDLSSNHLQGPIPKFFSDLEQLEVLSLSSNAFNGTLDLETFKSPHLSTFDLSNNDLFIISNDSLPLFPRIRELKLVSCHLQEFPQLSMQSELTDLDLSSNQLEGKIPNWIWEIGNGSLSHVNFSYNMLDDFQKPYVFPSLSTLDLRSNQFRGELLIPPSDFFYMDFSFNHFSGSIPNGIGNLLSNACFFSVSNNNLTGEIPTSMCNATNFQVLDLSGNALSGTIPSCLPMNNQNLRVLSLARNNLSGEIPDSFPVHCSLKTLDLQKNILEGKVPGSLVNCSSLEVLKLGNNRIEDGFPCMLMRTRLRILILRSNRFYGDIQCSTGWQSLQIIDLSTNDFSGDISQLSFSGWRGMIRTDGIEQSEYDYLRLDDPAFGEWKYQDTVTVTMKGLERELTKIFIVFTSIDFSRNKFNGSIDYTIGDLKSLYLLNLSHNEISGSIPASIGNLKQLGSLDLSVNKLTGKIPDELGGLTFLSFLNLSFNELFGKIPHGPQLQTFSASSYKGNAGLCGFPTNTSCSGSEESGVYSKKSEIDWDYVSAALGFAVGLGSSVWLLLHWRGCKERFCDRVDQFLIKVFTYKDGGRTSGRGRVTFSFVLCKLVLFTFVS